MPERVVYGDDEKLYVLTAAAEDYNTVFAELSRIFYDGQQNNDATNAMVGCALQALTNQDVAAYLHRQYGCEELPEREEKWQLPQIGQNLNPYTHSMGLQDDAESDVQVQARKVEKQSQVEQAAPWPPVQVVNFGGNTSQHLSCVCALDPYLRKSLY